VAEALDVPAIGLGAGRNASGQVLAVTDLLGLGGDSDSFSKRDADLDATIQNAVEADVNEVEERVTRADTSMTRRRFRVARSQTHAQ
jgi:3-methyl-2-oxobutanoate hydroxymethyltransferase